MHVRKSSSQQEAEHALAQVIARSLVKVNMIMTVFVVFQRCSCCKIDILKTVM